jgi:hypothetical protein
VSILPGIRQSRSLWSCLRVLGAGALILLLPAAPAAAQQPEEDVNARTEKIATTYRLTETVLRKYTTAMRELLALARRDPSVFETGGDSNSVHPAVRAIFTRTNLPEDELEKFSIAMGFAAMGDLAAAQSAQAAEQLKQTPVMRANVAFLKTHDTELKALGSVMNELRLLQEKKSGASAEADSEGGMKVTGTAHAGVNSEIELEVTGGPRAGRYAAKVTEGGCSYGLVKAGTWGNAYSISTEDPKKFSGLQLIVPDAKAAARGTKNFSLQANFGPLISLAGPGGTHYKVETDDEGETDGEGTVRVDDSGAGGTVTFDAKTKDGVGLKGTIRCHTVLRVTWGDR